MTAVSVVVPWRAGCPHREAAWAYVRQWWQDRHPDWQVVVGGCPDDGQWRKGVAVADAAARADGETAVVTDADVLCELVAPAVAAVAAGEVGWAMPHRGVYRLSRTGTDDLLGGGPLPVGLVNAPRRALGMDLVGVHTGVLGGGVVVLPVGTLRQVPIDPRFGGWGQEDTSWGRALTVLAGTPWRGHAPLWHLWHPPQPRLGRDRGVGSPESLALWRRYRRAVSPQQMRALLAEAGAG